ncbi:MAG: hypothetical protein FJ363_04135 [Gemmatimonadetes bacterium]|nr:hypothetical protein [Gemmatimonadota bacterium]
MLFRNDALTAQCEEMIAVVVHGAVLFRSGIGLALQDRPDEFQSRLFELKALEQQAGELQRALQASVERGGPFVGRTRRVQVARLAQAGDVVRRMTATLRRYAVEQPEPVLEGNTLLIDLAEHAKRTVDAMAAALRAQMTESPTASDLADAVHTRALDTREASEKYRRLIFRLDLRLSHKSQLSEFSEAIESVADAAAAVAAHAIAPQRGAAVSFGRWAFGRSASRWVVLSTVIAILGTVLTLSST